MFSLFRTLSWPVHIRNAAYIDDTKVLLSDGDGNIWQANPFSEHLALIHEGASVLSPVASVHSAARKPAAGTYPQLASRRDESAIIVNTHDLVLVLKNARIPWSLLTMNWGLYYPKMQFSSYPGEIFFLIQAENYTFVFEATTRQLIFESEEFVASAWHPIQNQLLVINATGEMNWIDFAKVEEKPTLRAIGKVESEITNASSFFEPNDLILLSDSQCVIASDNYFAAIDLLSFKTIHQVSRDSEILAYHSNGLALLRVSKEVSLWNLFNLKAQQKLPPTISQAFFSPSGDFLLTLDSLPTNPYPLSNSDTLRKASLWRVGDAAY